MMVKVLPNLNSLLFSAFYVNSDLNVGMNLYDEFCQIVVTDKTNWLIRGDFNKVLHAKETLGGPSINNSRIDHLRNYLNN